MVTTAKKKERVPDNTDTGGRAYMFTNTNTNICTMLHMVQPDVTHTAKLNSCEGESGRTAGALLSYC